jgi:UDP-N-acetyl-D-mannosaminuronic acid dehydrogenase
MNVNVIGLGYIGLPTSLVLARAGHMVRGVDVNQSVVDTLKAGRLHIVEPNLDEILADVYKSGGFAAETSPAAADVFIIAVPTPFKANHEPDVACVEAATKAICSVLLAGNLVIVESTSPVGTSEAVSAQIAAARPELTGSKAVHVAYCPERVLPGKILKELVENDRTVGGVTPEATFAAASFYKTFITGDVLETNARTAELVKLTENAYRDVNIAFANEVAHYSEALSIDPWEVIKLANHHPRVCILNPGPGVGGHCIAVDPWFIVHAAPGQTPLIRAAREVNDQKPHDVVRKVNAASSAFAERSGRPARIVCLGLTYKPDVDDLRESPALKIAKDLTKQHAGSVFCVDPLFADKLDDKALAGLQMRGLTQAMADADIILALVPHRPFEAIGADDLRGRIVIDTVGLWRRSAFQ